MSSSHEKSKYSGIQASSQGNQVSFPIAASLRCDTYE
jgi:hypothetical protein